MAPPGLAISSRARVWKLHHAPVPGANVVCANAAPATRRPQPVRHPPSGPRVCSWSFLRLPFRSVLLGSFVCSAPMAANADNDVGTRPVDVALDEKGGPAGWHRARRSSAGCRRPTPRVTARSASGTTAKLTGAASRKRRSTRTSATLTARRQGVSHAASTKRDREDNYLSGRARTRSQRSAPARSGRPAPAAPREPSRSGSVNARPIRRRRDRQLALR